MTPSRGFGAQNPDLAYQLGAVEVCAHAVSYLPEGVVDGPLNPLRHFRNGTMTTRVLRRGLSGMALAAYVGEALWKTGTHHGIKGVASLPWSGCRGLARILRCADSLGRLVAIFGIRCVEYRAIPLELPGDSRQGLGARMK